MAEKPAVTAAKIREALEVKYPGPEWHVEHELTLEGRRLDFVAFNRWGARAYRTVGFEIKVSQADYRRELENFRKSEIWTHVVDQFFIVAPSKLIDPDTLPTGWGLLELRGSKLFTKAQASIGSSKTLPRELAARMIDRLYRSVEQAKGRFHEERWRLEEQLREELRRDLAAEAERSGDEFRAKAERYDALLREFGYDRRWEPHESLVRALRFLLKHDVLSRMDHLVTHLDGQLERHKQDLTVFTQARELVSSLRNPT